jgi:3-deoxy-D-arabino-heptulosonate 7-phosphate (DAHP) synthase
MAKEWVSTGFCIVFNTDRSIMLDLDNMTFRSALRTAETLLKQYRLEGFLLIRSSPKNYHVVFNRYRRSIQNLFNQIPSNSRHILGIMFRI